MKNPNGKLHVFICEDNNTSVCKRVNWFKSTVTMRSIREIRSVLEYSGLCKQCRAALEKELANEKTEQDQQTATQEE